MPVVITSKDKEKVKDKESDKSAPNALAKGKSSTPAQGRTRFPTNVSEVPIPAMIGVGVLALLFMLFMFNRYVTRITPSSGPGYEKVAPLPGYPDQPPYNDAAWQRHPMPTPGMPPPEALQRMKGGPPAGDNR